MKPIYIFLALVLGLVLYKIMSTSHFGNGAIEWIAMLLPVIFVVILIAGGLASRA